MQLHELIPPPNVVGAIFIFVAIGGGLSWWLALGCVGLVLVVGSCEDE